MQNRNLMLSRRRIDSDTLKTIEFPEKNTLFSGTYGGKDYSSSPGGNSHRTAAVGVSAIDGTIHLAYDNHYDKLNYRMSKKNIAFADDSEFTLSNFLPEQNHLATGEVLGIFTYPGFDTNDAGELILNYRIGGTRRGNMMIAFYDGTGWSPNYILINGTDHIEDEQFNIYGDLKYINGKLYMGGTMRAKNSPIAFNQGIYFADGGQQGITSWSNFTGISKSLPIGSKQEMETFKIASPLPDGHNGMTGSPSFAVTKSGAVYYYGHPK